MGGDAAMIELDEKDPQNDICHICCLRRWWHEENAPHHAFVLAEEGSKLAPAEAPAPPAQPMQMGDPILRAALVRCGALNEMQITEAEAWVREAARQGKALVVSHRGYELQDVEVVAREVGESAGPE